MKTVNRDPFSNGTEFDRWTERNCDRCIKDSHLKKYETGYTKVVCAVQRDIFSRMWSNEPIALRSYEACQQLDCPYRKEKWPKKARYTQKEKLL